MNGDASHKKKWKSSFSQAFKNTFIVVKYM